LAIQTNVTGKRISSMPRNQRKLGLLGAALLCLLAIAVKWRQDRPAAGIVAQPEKLSPSSKTRLNDSTTGMEKSLVDPKENTPAPGVKLNAEATARVEQAVREMRDFVQELEKKNAKVIQQAELEKEWTNPRFPRPIAPVA
jgi:hypothetical protein